MDWFKDWRNKRKLKMYKHKTSEEEYTSKIKEIDDFLKKNEKEQHEED